jgi:hypothetical protein
MTGFWHEHIENGRREFRRRLDGELMVIRPYIEEAWICELAGVQRAAEACAALTSSAPRQ